MAETVEVVITATDRASSVLSGIGSGLRSVGTIALGAAAAGLGAVATGIGAVAVAAVQGNAQFEQYNTQFEVLLGSAEAAQQRMAELSEFGATTPFDLPQVVEADRILQGFGLHAEQTAEQFGFSGEQIRTIAGDVASGTGVSFQEMASMIGRFSAGATGEAIARMQELGITNRAELAAMGLEFSNSGQLLSPLPEAMGVVLSLMEEKYGGLMEAQSGTFTGMLSNLSDWKDATIRRLGEPIFNLVKDQLSGLLTFLNSPEVMAALDEFANMLATGIGEAVGLVTEVFGEIQRSIEAGLTPFQTLMEILDNFLPQETIDMLWGLYDVISGILGPIIEAATNFVSWKDILGGLAIAIGTVVVPAIYSILSALAPIIAAFGAAVLAIAVLRNAWENDWLGIRTFITDAWNNTIKPALIELWNWLQVNIPLAIEALKTYWETVLLPALQNFWTWVQTSLIPIFVEIGNWLQTNIPVAIQTVSDFWNTVLLPALQTAWAYINDNVIPILANIAAWLQTNIPVAIQTVSDFWNLTLLPALQAAWAYINDNILPIFSSAQTQMEGPLSAAINALSLLWTETLKPALEAVWAFINDSVKPLFEALANVAEAILGAALRVLKGIITDEIIPAFQTFWGYVNDNIVPILETAWVNATTAVKDALDALERFINDNIGPTIQWLKDNILGPMTGSLDAISGAIQGVIGWLEDLAAKIAEIDWGLLQPGSPTPLEIGLWGIHTAMGEVSKQMGDLAGQVTRMPPLSPQMGADDTGRGGGIVRQGPLNQMTMNVYTSATTATVAADFNLMESLAMSGA